MNQHRFILQPYKGPSTRHTCPQCEKSKTFVRYVDIEGEIDLPDFVGRCGREANCTYHYTPKQFFADYPDHKPGKADSFMPRTFTRPIQTKAVTPMSFMDADLVASSLNHYERNNLIKYLHDCVGEAKAYELAALYQIGTSNHWKKQGASVFWQRDEQGRVRGGKVMLYDPSTGRRRKDEAYKPTWVHSVLKLSEFALSQCLYGLHQLPTRPADVVAIVESEKTAIIATAHFPRFIWLATGGIANLNAERCQALKGRKVVLYPDLSADGSVYAKWSQKAKELSTIAGLQVGVSTYLEEKATDEQRQQGLDLADFLTAAKPIIYDEQPVSEQPHRIKPVPESDLPDWYTAFNLPWKWDASATLARVRWMVLPLHVEEGSAEDRAGQPVATLAEWAANPGTILRPKTSTLQYL